MKKFKIVLLIIAFSLSTILLIGCIFCGEEPSLSPEEIIDKGMRNLYDAESLSYEVELNGGVAIEEEGIVDAEQEGSSEADLYIFAEGFFNLLDSDNSQFAAKIDGNMSADSETFEFGLELRINADYLYAMLDKLPDLGEEVPTDLLDMFVGKWWKIPIPEEEVEGINFKDLFNGEEDMNPEQKEIRELFKNTKFFKKITYINNQKVSGIVTHHYNAELDKAATKDFFIKASEINNDPMLQEDIDHLDALMAANDFYFEIWVGEDDLITRKFKGDMSMISDVGGEMNFEVIAVFTDFNKKLNVKIPEDATEFDPMMMLGLAAMMGTEEEAVE